MALVLGAGVFGAWRISRPVAASEELRVALLQPNLTEESRSAGAVTAYQSVLAQADEAGDNLPALIVLPESALPVYWQRSEKLRQDLATIAMRGSAVLFNDVEEDSDGRYYNSLDFDGSGSRTLLPQDHLVPFESTCPCRRSSSSYVDLREISAFSARPAGAAEGWTLPDSASRLLEILWPLLTPEADERTCWRDLQRFRYGRAGAQSSTSPARCCGRSRTRGY
jgi:apolipoprotein N-acyltransferase